MDKVKSGSEESTSSGLILPSELQVMKQSLIFDYQIRATFRRKHHNPPVWMENHWHDFQVTLHLRAQRNPSDMYGLDLNFPLEKMTEPLSRGSLSDFLTTCYWVQSTSRA